MNRARLPTPHQEAQGAREGQTAPDQEILGQGAQEVQEAQAAQGQEVQEDQEGQEDQEVLDGQEAPDGQTAPVAQEDQEVQEGPDGQEAPAAQEDNYRWIEFLWTYFSRPPESRDSFRNYVSTRESATRIAKNS